MLIFLYVLSSPPLKQCCVIAGTFPAIRATPRQLSELYTARMSLTSFTSLFLTPVEILCVCAALVHIFGASGPTILCHDPPQYYSFSQSLESGDRVFKNCPNMPKNRTKDALAPPIATKLLRGLRQDNVDVVWQTKDGGNDTVRIQ